VWATHTSEFADGSNGGNPGGFIIEADGKTIYVAGDTGLMYDMQLWGEMYDFDLVVLPIGDVFTMGATHASKAALLLQCNHILGYHYDTFPPICLDKEQTKAIFADNKQELLLPEIGSSITL
jgi:L-ascorbate metabolism protein UlaG (beta-lactamase superfamily)